MKWNEVREFLRDNLSSQEFAKGYVRHRLMAMAAEKIVGVIDSIGGVEGLQNMISEKECILDIIKEEVYSSLDEDAVRAALQDNLHAINLFSINDCDILLSKITSEKPAYGDVLAANRNWYVKQIYDIFTEVDRLVR